MLANLHNITFLVSYWWMYLPALARRPGFARIFLAGELVPKNAPRPARFDFGEEVLLMIRTAFRCILSFALLSGTSFLWAATPTPQPVVAGEGTPLNRQCHRGIRRPARSCVARGEPKTFNPLKRSSISPRATSSVRMSSDLLHIHAISQQNRSGIGEELEGLARWAQVHAHAPSRIAFFRGHPFSADECRLHFSPSSR